MSTGNTALKVAAGSAEERGVTPYEKFRDYTSRPAFISDLKTMLGNEQAAREFVRVVLTAVQQTPDLLSADRRTLLLACMKAARARLMPDGKEAVLNIFSTKTKGQDGREVWVKQVQFMPMAFGLVKTLYDSGIAKYVDAAAVYEKDKFSYKRGDNQSLEHEPSMADDPGPVVAAYCVVVLATGHTKREVMPRRDIEKVRAISKSPDGLMWGKFYDQGAIKSVIHRICKQLPSRPEVEGALQGDIEAMGFSQSGSSGIDVDTESFSGEAVERERPALEHSPAETVPTNVPKERAAAKVETKAPADDRPSLEMNGEPPDYTAKASDEQKAQITKAAKSAGFNVAQMDEKLVERFGMGLDELPAAMVADALQLVSRK